MKRKIVLDAGHGEGKAFNRGSRIGNEGDNNYEMANILKAELEKKGFEVTLTRNKSNDNPTLAERGKAGKGHDLLLSLHTNAGGGSGIEIWDDVNPKYSNKALAESICKEVSKLLNIKNRGVKYRKTEKGNNYYGVLANGQANSNMIIEWVFHDNRDEVQKYVEKMKEIAEVTAKVIAEHYNVTEQKPVKTVNNAKSKQYEKGGLNIIETTADNIQIVQMGGKALKDTNYSGINGTFFNAALPALHSSTWSIAVNEGRVIGSNAHTNDWSGKIKRATLAWFGGDRVYSQYTNNFNEYKLKPTWAIGGVGLIPSYDPNYEKVPADILRKTYHTAMAFKRGKIYLITSQTEITLTHFKTLIENAISPDSAINLDGGGSTQMKYANQVFGNSNRRLNNAVILKEI